MISPPSDTGAARRNGGLFRLAAQRWFARAVVFTTTVDTLLAARDAWRRRDRVLALGVAGQYAEPHFLRHCVLSPLARRVAGR